MNQLCPPRRTLCPKFLPNETHGVAARCTGLMSLKLSDEAAGDGHMERRIIRVDNMPDHAGITAALRRAFAERPPLDCFAEDDMFDALLKQLN